LPRDLSTALIAAAHLLLGIGNTVSLTIAMLLSRGSAPLLGLVHGLVALGVIIQTCIINLYLDVGARHWTAALLLALARGCSALFLSQAMRCTPAAAAAAAGGYEAAETGDEMILSRGGFPPPASRLTILGALFAFAYQAAMVVVPVWLVSWTGGEPSSSTGQMPLVYAVVPFWAGIVIGVGSLALTPSVEQKKQLVSSALVASAGLLLPAWVLGDVFWNAAATGALVGFLMGPAYPWMVALLIRETSEEERLSGIAIVVAFGTAGAVTALSIIHLASQLESPAVLHLAVLGLFGGMLMCWNAMSDANRKT
jgi:hypothetical protein